MRCHILDYKRFYPGSMHGGLVTIHRCTSSSHRYGRCDHITHLLTLTHSYSHLLTLTYSLLLTHKQPIMKYFVAACDFDVSVPIETNLRDLATYTKQIMSYIL